MAFRALLFSKSPETNAALTAVCKAAGIRVEACTDIFSAMEKGTKQPFSCIITDWSDQPEAGFLLKRSRESVPNVNTIAIAIVDSEPAAAEMRDHRLDFLLYRPISPDEARDVLSKAGEKMQTVSVGASETPETDQPAPEDPHVSASPEPAEQVQDRNEEASGSAEPDAAAVSEDGIGTSEEGWQPPTSGLPIRKACAAVLVLAAAFFLWNARYTVLYLAQTREGRIKVLQESVAALFYMTPSGAMPVGSAGSDAQQDAYFSRNSSNSTGQAPELTVASTEAHVNDSQIQLRKPADFPLPTPVFIRTEAPPVHVQRAEIPESLRGAAPITPPVVVTVNPAQMMPVSAPVVAPLSTQQFSEPVAVSEDAERSLLVHSVNPTYPQEAMAQKLHGPVVLAATIGRDGHVEDLKIVRGYFILGKAAIAAVKQWRFQPYTINGKAAQTQTTITINFSYPPG